MRGEVRKRTWTYDGKRREAWGFTLTLDGRRVRRQSFGSRAEAQEALDGLRHPELRPAPSAVAPSSITLAQAFTRYFQAKARKRSLFEDERLARHL